MDYTGIKCPVCEKTFTKQDDVVVCPECGAPYHRECYQKEGHCIFEEEASKRRKLATPSRKKRKRFYRRGNTPLPSLRQRKQPVFPFLRSLWNVAFRRSSCGSAEQLRAIPRCATEAGPWCFPAGNISQPGPYRFSAGFLFWGRPFCAGPYGGSKSQRTY